MKYCDSGSANDEFKGRTTRHFKAAQGGASALPAEDERIRAMFPLVHSDYTYYVLENLDGAIKILDNAIEELVNREHRPVSDIDVFKGQKKFYKSELEKSKGKGE